MTASACPEFPSARPNAAGRVPCAPL